MSLVCAAAGGQPADQERGTVREELETDRDSFTFAPTTMGLDTSILETSYSFIDNRNGPEAHSFPELLLRHGITRKIEARRRFFKHRGGLAVLMACNLWATPWKRGLMWPSPS